jgi:hypothetical protein
VGFAGRIVDMGLFSVGRAIFRRKPKKKEKKKKKKREKNGIVAWSR